MRTKTFPFCPSKYVKIHTYTHSVRTSKAWYWNGEKRNEITKILFFLFCWILLGSYTLLLEKRKKKTWACSCFYYYCLLLENNMHFYTEICLWLGTGMAYTKHTSSAHSSVRRWKQNRNHCYYVVNFQVLSFLMKLLLLRVLFTCFVSKPKTLTT